MSFIIMVLSVIAGCFGIQKLSNRGLKAGWLAITILSFTTWFLAVVYQLSQWGIK